MKNSILRSVFSKLFRLIGYDLRKFNLSHIEGFLGFDMFHDLKILFGNDFIKVVDVGASNGEWMLNLKKYIKNIDTYFAFEPDLRESVKLMGLKGEIRDFRVFTHGVGLKNEQKSFNFMDSSSMNSFLELGNEGWGYKIKSEVIQIKSLDEVLGETQGMNIDFDLLKIDTQGFDFEVLKGANLLLKNQSFNVIICEVNFQNLYQQTFNFGELIDYMKSHNYVLFGTYYPYIRNFSLAWFDAMFISASFIDHCKSTNKLIPNKYIN